MPNINTLLFDNIYHLYYHSLLKVIKHTICRDEIAEDVLQDAFVKIWISLPGYNADKGNIYTWMATICRHLAIDHIRSVSYQKQFLTDQLEIKISAVDTEKSCSFNPDCMDVVQHVKELAKPCCDAILLSFCEGYTHTEIVELLGIPIGTVKSRIRAGLRQLRKRYS